MCNFSSYCHPAADTPSWTSLRHRIIRKGHVYISVLARQIGTPNIAKTTTLSQADGHQGLET